ncbi:unnamed protein product [Rotaria sordida]|uniref:Uncharacterized protein n=1 Tax=Rotaria sordida TaxID=392033 RepID=A0A814PX92_9BILA|nr:unnamed protein product [Rotaria sordida]CAF1332037.1 unnamed protein product [Rotaria sordida]
MFVLLFFFYSINFVTSLSSQEDLSIKKYSQIGCLILKSDKQFIVNHIQENSRLPYQTFSSTHMTIELCFRLCRRWIILMYNNQTNCICLYTIDKPYEFNQYLGEFLSINNCTSNDIKIYSLTNDLYIFPTLLSSTSDDWSLDGCYYLQGIQTIRVNLGLNHVDYIQAIDLCQKHCQKSRRTNYFSFFLSRKKSCYCLPVKISQTIKPIALRKPLIHCSFLPYICHGFSNICEKYYLKTNVDTLIKIDVQHYCSVSYLISFVFDRIFYMCFTSILLQTEMNFSIINNKYKCLPLVIKTYEQWNYLIESSWIIHIRTFIWIDQNSKYIFNDLLKFNNLTLLSNNLCMIIIRTESNKISYELIQCNTIQSPGYFLCTQKPLESAIPYEEEFKIINNESELLVHEILSCPPEFILFNKICYYIHSSFIYNIRSGERLCYNQYSNSTLVKYDSHEWGNIDVSRFLGRTFADILIEFFYYILENKLLIESIDESNRKQWLRLLFGDKNDPNECVLRYFARSSGSFTTFYRCNNGGHPVCQCEPIRTKISKIISMNEAISNTNNSQIEIQNESIKITSTTQIIVINSTDILILPNETNMSFCENCTTSSLADKDLNNNNTEINSTSYNNALLETLNQPTKASFLSYQPLIVILTGPILALIILILGTGLLIYHVRRSRESHSTSSSIVGNRRTERSSTILTSTDFPSTSGTLYTRLKPSGLPFAEIDTFLPVDNSTPNDDSIELLPTIKVQITNDENKIKEDDEELIYATLK